MAFQSFEDFTTGAYWLPQNFSEMSVSESLGLNMFGGELGIEELSFQSEEDAQSWWDWIWNGVEKAAGGILEVGLDIIKNLPPIVIRTGDSGIQIPRTGTGTRPRTGTIPGTTTGGRVPITEVRDREDRGFFGNIDTSTLLIGGAIGLGLIMLMMQRR